LIITKIKEQRGKRKKKTTPLSPSEDSHPRDVSGGPLHNKKGRNWYSIEQIKNQKMRNFIQIDIQKKKQEKKKSGNNRPR
jgi:hypothetical protein